MHQLTSLSVLALVATICAAQPEAKAELKARSMIDDGNKAKNDAATGLKRRGTIEVFEPVDEAPHLGRRGLWLSRVLAPEPDSPAHHGSSVGGNGHQGSVDGGTHQGSIDRTSHQGGIGRNSREGSIDRNIHEGSTDRNSQHEAVGGRSSHHEAAGGEVNRQEASFNQITEGGFPQDLAESIVVAEYRMQHTVSLIEVVRQRHPFLMDDQFSGPGVSLAKQQFRHRVAQQLDQAEQIQFQMVYLIHHRLYPLMLVPEHLRAPKLHQFWLEFALELSKFSVLIKQMHADMAVYIRLFVHHPS